MRTDTAPGRASSAKFALAAVAWSLALFGALRLNWTEVHVVLPLAHAQGEAARWLFRATTLPVVVSSECSGTDALSLCVGAILAYPVRWRARLAAAAVGGAFILALNIARIATLARAVGSPTVFDALHLYVWPLLLTIAIAGYVFTWMRFEDGRETVVARPFLTSGALAKEVQGRDGVILTRRFAVLAAIFLIVFIAASPLYIDTAAVLAVAAFITRAGGFILNAIGVHVSAAGNVLWTPRGGFTVTGECIATPLLPIYLAAVLARPMVWRWRLLAVLAAVPLFIALGVLRLLVVALPEAIVASPLFLVHAFYQLLLGAVVVGLAARWRHRGPSAALYGLGGLLLGIAFLYFAGGLYTRVFASSIGFPANDPQGAVAFLPSFQVGLYLAVWVAACSEAGWMGFVTGLVALPIAQVLGLFTLATLASHWDWVASVPEIRGWAIVGPLAVIAIVVNCVAPRR